jgi:hypothetical protein
MDWKPEMRWVDDPTYVGSDRRKARAMRLLNRRRADQSGAAPSLPAALRQLGVRVMDARNPAGLKKFSERLRATSKLAKDYGNGAVADALMKLAQKLEMPRAPDMRPMIEAELRRILLSVNAATYSLR